MSRLPLVTSHHEMHRPLPQRAKDEMFALEPDEEPQLSEYRDMLLDHKLLIACVLALTVGLSLLYVTFASPVYRANLLLQIEDSAPASKSFLTDTTGLGDLKTTASGEMQVIGSRMVLGAVVDQLGLEIVAGPRYVPFIGTWLARQSKQLSNPGLLGFDGYVSGAERIAVSRFAIPGQLEDTTPFKLTALGEGRYEISHNLLTERLQGKAGVPLLEKTPDGDFNILISELAGNPGAQFTVSVASRLSAIEQLQQRLLMSEQGRQSNVLNVALDDSDRRRLSLVLNAIGEQYIRQNVDRKSAEAEKTLAFLNSQLPVFENQLKESEDAYARFRNQHGTIAFDEEARVWLRSSAELQTNLLQLQQSRRELTRTNNNDHPRVQTVDQQIAAVQSQLGELNKKITAMPNVQRDALRLERDVRANGAQFQSMQNNALQMRLLKEGKIGNVRLLDSAMVSKQPVKPQKSLIMLFAFVIGALIGPALAIFLGKTKKGLYNPNQLSANTGLELYGVIPQSPEQSLMTQDKKKAESGELLADLYPNSRSVEALRGLRVGLKLALESSSNNRILITGATPGIGKSFVANNFAILLAQTGKRVLLINADLRKGGEQTDFGLVRDQGLSELLDGKIGVTQAIRANVRPNLDVLTTGKLADQPADMLESKSFALLLNQLSEQYDHLVIDTAPILVATDAVAVAPLCGCVLLLARAGNSQIRDLHECIRRLAQAGAPVDGLLMNGLDTSRRTSGSYGYQPDSYRYSEVSAKARG